MEKRQGERRHYRSRKFEKLPRIVEREFADEKAPLTM